MRHGPRLVPMLLCGLATLSAPVIAQTARSGGSGGANAQAMRQLQQLAAERTALEADNAKLKQQLAEAQKERDALKAREQALSQRLRSAEAGTSRAAAATATRESTEKELNDLKGRSQELIAKFRETAQTLRDVEVDRAAARQSLTAREGELKACVDRNAALYTLNGELVTRLESDGGWSRIARAEPFTRLKRIELENLADDYRTRAEDQRVAPAPAAAPAATPATSTTR